MVVKTPFYTWCPDDYILHLVSFHDHGHDHHAVTVIIITAVVTLHVGRQCSHPCRGRSLHSGDAAIKQHHKRQHDININTRVFITKVNLKQKLNNPWVTSSTCPHKSCCSSRTIPDEEEDKAENIGGGCFSGWSQMVTIKQNWPWKKCFRRTFSNYDMTDRNRVQLLIKFQYHWHNSFMCFLQYLLFTSISGCCNKSFTMNMCPPEQKSLQRVCLFVCLFVFFVCLFGYSFVHLFICSFIYLFVS